MRDVFSYDLREIENKEVIVYGCGETSRKFAIRLINNDIKFHYFLNILKVCIATFQEKKWNKKVDETTGEKREEEFKLPDFVYNF